MSCHPCTETRHGVNVSGVRGRGNNTQIHKSAVTHDRTFVLARVHVCASHLSVRQVGLFQCNCVVRHIRGYTLTTAVVGDQCKIILRQTQCTVGHQSPGLRGTDNRDDGGWCRRHQRHCGIQYGRRGGLCQPRFSLDPTLTVWPRNNVNRRYGPTHPRPRPAPTAPPPRLHNSDVVPARMCNECGVSHVVTWRQPHGWYRCLVHRDVPRSIDNTQTFTTQTLTARRGATNFEAAGPRRSHVEGRGQGSENSKTLVNSFSTMS